MKWIKLFEDYRNSNITKNSKFYLAIDDYNKIFNNELFLSKGILKGLSGISSSEDIIDNLGTGCDILIEMLESEVLKLNKVSKVEYDNVAYLCANNFKNLKRIMGASFMLYSTPMFIEKMFHEMDTQGDINIIKDVDENLYNFLTKDIKKLFSIEKPNVNSLEDFCQLIASHTDFKYEMLYPILHEYIISLVEKYRYEEEWIVESDLFIVPSGSVLKVFMSYVDDNVDNDKLFPKVKKDIEEKSENLTNYEVLIIN